jgi:hypothetical protein
VEIGGKEIFERGGKKFGGKCRNGFRGSVFCVVPYLSFCIFLIKCMPGCKGSGRGRLKEIKNIMMFNFFFILFVWPTRSKMFAKSVRCL